MLMDLNVTWVDNARSERPEIMMSFNLSEIVTKEIAAQPVFDSLANEGQQFVAWYVHRVLGASPMDAMDALTDGAKDKQIDAVHIDHDLKRVVIVQGKYYEARSVTGEAIRECLAAIELLQDLAHLQTVANPKLQKKVYAISFALRDDYEVVAENVTVGKSESKIQNPVNAAQPLIEALGFFVTAGPCAGRYEIPAIWELAGDVEAACGEAITTDSLRPVNMPDRVRAYAAGSFPNAGAVCPQPRIW